MSRDTDAATPPPGFIADMTTEDLGAPAAFLLFGFRACASGHDQCCMMVRGFQAAFDRDARAALDDLMCFTRILGRDGRRKIRLAHPGCMRVTADELCLAAALASAQSGDMVGRAARLEWLFAGLAPRNAVGAVDRLAATFACHGHWLQLPDLSATDMSNVAAHVIDLRTVTAAGTA